MNYRFRTLDHSDVFASQRKIIIVLGRTGVEKVSHICFLFLALLNLNDITYLVFVSHTHTHTVLLYYSEVILQRGGGKQTK